MKTKSEKLVALIQKNPGLDAIALKGKGFRPQSHGSLKDAEAAGLLAYVNGGWYVAGDEPLSGSRQRSIRTALGVLCNVWESGGPWNFDGHPNNSPKFPSWEAVTTAPRPTTGEMVAFARMNGLRFCSQQPSGPNTIWQMWFEKAAVAAEAARRDVTPPHPSCY